ncbi:hypothetical protein [Dokdonella sp.]|uniref:hypothetical protein n=1 Tax=Dokdonella sp. TaxID=2291710 RepID=UPI002D80EDA1|nr:hypothetical protein [Dokdonella sp.]
MLRKAVAEIRPHRPASSSKAENACCAKRSRHISSALGSFNLIAESAIFASHQFVGTESVKMTGAEHVGFQVCDLCNSDTNRSVRSSHEVAMIAQNIGLTVQIQGRNRLLVNS